MRTSFFIWILCASSVSAEEPPTSKVEGVMIIPKTVGTFMDQTVEIRLYKYDPRIADKAADLVDLVRVEKYSHTAGKESKKTFTLGQKSKLDPRMSYYVTLFILKDKKRAHIGECAHRKGLCTVLTRGQPQKIKMTVRPVR